MPARRASKRPHEASDDDEEDVKSSQPRLSQWTEEDINIEKSNSNGIIEKIHVRNFMCHASMEINFNERINFVVGRNGSGKSAILMALVVGLGGKASATNRGTSIKEFIKKGEKSATVEIVLKNSGLSPYKHEVYGDRITVIRTISTGSTVTSYKIKSAAGEVVSTKREELDRIVSALNIQVDNPVSVLNQDTSRTFLNSSDPGDKYTLFMRATELEKLLRFHKEAVASRVSAHASVELKKEALALAKKEVDVLQKQWNVLKSIPRHRMKIEALENEHLWAQAIDKERVLAVAAGRLTEEEARLKKLGDRYQNQTGQEEALQEKLRDLQAQLTELKEENSSYEENFNAAKAKYVRCKESFSSKAKDCKTLDSRIANRKIEQDTLAQEIARLHQETGPDYLERRAAERERLAALEVELGDRRATAATVDHHLNQLRANEQAQAREQRQLAQVDRAERQRRRDKIRASIQDLRSSSNSNLNVFNRNTEEFHRRIEEAYRAGRFTRKPVGPLGAYVQVRDARWTVAVEACLGAALTKYRCHDGADMRVLTQIMKQVIDANKRTWTGHYPEPQPGKITGQFRQEVYDTSRRAVRCEGYMNVFDAIVVTDPVAANALIDDCSPETVILLPTSEDAYKLMSRAANVPANCRRGFTMAGDTYHPSPNYKTYAATRSRAMYLQVSTEDVLRQREGELVAAEQELVEVEGRLTQLAAQLAETRRQVALDGAEVRKLRAAEQRIAAEISTLRDTAEPEVNCIASLTSDLEECKEKIAEMQARQVALAAESAELRALMDGAKGEADQLRQNAHRANVKEQPILAEMEKNRTELRSYKTDQLYRKGKVDEQQAKVNEATDAVREAERVAATFVQNAEEITPRINTRRKASDLLEEKRGLETYLASVEREKGSYLDVTREYHEKNAKYTQTLQLVQENQQLCQLLETRLMARSKLYEQIRRLTKMAVQFYFKFRLQQRAYKGDIVIDDVKKTLNIDVTPAHRVETSKKDTKTLSGGERSYSTVVFIMALWDSVNLPFYFMDEFDVFMDKVNRRIIMDMLLEVARDKANRQFVFLTPQDTSSIQTDQHVTIHRMEDPRA